jgi:microcystin-dependent protein
MAFFGQPSLAALLPLSAGQNLADVPDKTAALANLGTLSTSDIMLNSVPIGTIIPFWGNTAPVGYLPCNGQTVNSGTFPDLVTFLGGGSSQVLPDLRGEFLRGWDNGRGIDSSRAVKTLQLDAFQGHYHNETYSSAISVGTGGSSYAMFTTSGNNAGPITDSIRAAISDGTNGTPRTSIETRPRNVSVLYCMKAYGALVNTSTANMGNVLTELSQCTKLTQFGVSLAASGYQKLPSGMILQWGTVVGSASAPSPFTFPIVFPTALVSLTATVAITALSGTGVFATIESQSATGASYQAWSAATTRSALNCYYVAIGY